MELVPQSPTDNGSEQLLPAGDEPNTSRDYVPEGEAMAEGSPHDKPAVLTDEFVWTPYISKIRFIKRANSIIGKKTLTKDYLKGMMDRGGERVFESTGRQSYRFNLLYDELKPFNLTFNDFLDVNIESDSPEPEQTQPNQT